MQNLLRFLMKTVKPNRILEIGTAVGFSSLLMAHYAPEETVITTIAMSISVSNPNTTISTDAIMASAADAAAVSVKLFLGSFFLYIMYREKAVIVSLSYTDPALISILTTPSDAIIISLPENVVNRANSAPRATGFSTRNKIRADQSVCSDFGSPYWT